MAKNSIFLSGWEYNRLFGSRPEQPLISGLPGHVLWNGSAQFWMFEKVYCTKESLDGEIAAYHSPLEWSTGYIFEDLSRRGFLTPIDWDAHTKANEVVREQLHQRWAGLNRICTKPQLLEFLRCGNESALQEITTLLLDPLTSSLNCVQNLPPNSISHWMGTQSPALDLQENVTAGLAAVANSVRQLEPATYGGFALCTSPAIGVSAAELAAQDRVKNGIEKPMIPDLLGGNLAHQDYLKALEPSANVYKPVNDKLKAEYEKRIGKLERLRDVAQRHLWTDLHSDWIPRLQREPSFLPKLKQLLATALRRSEYDLLLQQGTEIGMGVSSAVVGLAAVTAALAVTPVAPIVGVVGATAIATTYRVLDAQNKQERQETEKLTVFYQKAKTALV